VRLKRAALGSAAAGTGADSCMAASGPGMAALYAAEAPRLRRFFRRRTACPEEANDLVQETFTRALGAEPQAALRKPEAYLTRIAQNLLRDRAKFARRRSADLHVPADETILPGTDQHRLLEARDMLDRLDLAMLELPPATREIFMAHRLDGLSYAEIAEATGGTVKAVEKAISRALNHLDRALGPR
jgi:RNA polymerase sigma-70 factor (ECF subfamily)